MVAFWLMPSAETADFFASLIRTLAVEQDAPVFDAHLTLYAGRIDEAAAIAALHVAPTSETYELVVEGIDHSGKFTKTVFVQFRASTELQQLSDALRELVNGARDYQLNPHLSLIYKDLPESARFDLARTLTMPFERVTFDRLRVIAAHDDTTSREDVESWRVLAESSLR